MAPSSDTDSWGSLDRSLLTAFYTRQDSSSLFQALAHYLSLTFSLSLHHFSFTCQFAALPSSTWFHTAAGRTSKLPWRLHLTGQLSFLLIFSPRTSLIMTRCLNDFSQYPPASRVLSLSPCPGFPGGPNRNTPSTKALLTRNVLLTPVMYGTQFAGPLGQFLVLHTQWCGDVTCPRQ